MLKTLFTFLIIIISVDAVNARSAVLFKDTVIYYSKSRERVASADSAYYIHKILPFDTVSQLYPVVEYYMTGKPKLKAYAVNNDGSVNHGTRLEYFENGKRKSIATYFSGQPIGKEYQYYPNGELYAIKEHLKQDLFLLECHDTTGKVVAKDGEGTWLDYDYDFVHFYISGPVVQGKKEGEWCVKVNDEITEVEEYENSICVKGYFKNKQGQNVEWSDDIVPGPNYSRIPVFKGGLPAFGDFLAKNLRYPSRAITKEIQGRVYVSFIVTEKGKLTNIKIVRGIGYGCDEEVIRVMKLSPDWIPQHINGKAVRELYTVPVVFNIASL